MSTLNTTDKLQVPDVFHIGYPRCGSTWIQKGLFPILSKYIYSTKANDWFLLRASTKEEVTSLYSDKRAESDQGRIIIESEEGFSGNNYRDYLEMPKKISWVNPNAKIIICIRSQFTIIPSLYYIYVKKGGTLSFRHYVKILLENRKLDYWSLYNSYIEIFGKHNVKVVQIENLANNPKSYVDDILGWLKINASYTVPDQRFRNNSPTVSYIAAFRYLNILLRIDSIFRSIDGDVASTKLMQRLRIRRLLYKPISYFLKILEYIGLGKGKLIISPDIQNEIVETYGAGNRCLIETSEQSLNGDGYPGLG